MRAKDSHTYKIYTMLCTVALANGFHFLTPSLTRSNPVPSATSLSFFQIKVDIPPECRIYPIESEDEDEENRAASRGAVGAKEIICPWESLTPQNGTG